MSDITINQEVTWTEMKPVETTILVKTCKIKSVTIMLANENISTSTVYEWLDSDGKVVRKGLDRKTNQQLQEKIGEAFANIKNALCSIIDTNAKMPMLIINFTQNGMSFTITHNGHPTVMKEVEINTALQPFGLDVSSITAIINSLGFSVVTGA